MRAFTSVLDFTCFTKINTVVQRSLKLFVQREQNKRQREIINIFFLFTVFGRA